MWTARRGPRLRQSDMLLRVLRRRRRMGEAARERGAIMSPDAAATLATNDDTTD
jgi:hypothetical protein